MARTLIPLVIQPPLGMADQNCIEGVVAKTDQFSITTDVDTTAVIYIGGLIPWRLHNESGGAVTVTLYDAGTKDGAELTIYDVDDQPIAAFSVADGGSVDISDAAGVLHLIVKGGTAASGLRVVAKR